MSTIASPRPSISASSRRTSTSTDTTTTQTTAVDRGSLRRNRAALRDYYGLQNASATASEATPQGSFDNERTSEIDAPGFQPSTYVSNLLAKENLDSVLKTEASLVSEIRSLDGEKKALVYDNYSKLIAATDTIRVMREKMDPMMPGTSTLGPAVGHIAETATGLAGELRKAGSGRGEVDRKGERESVRWVLGAPGRLRGLLEGGRREEAEREWSKVQRLLTKWEGVKGVEEVRRGCEEVMGTGEET